jgi:proteasome lid subunit RPN8/RPN11
MPVVVIPGPQLDEIIGHATASPSEEICGILGGRDGRVERVYRAQNAADPAQRRTRFTMDPRDIMEISDRIEDDGLDLIGFYHSHTHTQAYPSPTDVADWPARWYPDALCFICSLMDEERPHVRGFHIDESGAITEDTVSVE